MITYEDIRKANESIRTMDIKGKEYAEVNQRIKAFRMVYPTGYICTDMLSNENGVCIFNAEVGYFEESGRRVTLSNGTAYEKENSSYINKTSYIENCETSAVGRALGMAGFGIDTSVASYEEVANAVLNQGQDAPKATPKQIAVLQRAYTGENLDKLLKANKIAKLEDISIEKASELIGRLKGDK